MQEVNLTPVSYIVLGLVQFSGRTTPYDLKRLVASSVGNFWTIQHAQLYSEPERLAAAGYLTEDRETGGRRRKRYEITARGREAMAEWRASPTAALAELRDHGLLKLFFGADPQRLAPVQLEAHRAKLAEYEQIRTIDTGAEPRGPWLALEAGIRSELVWIEYWEALARPPG
ncbi:MAG: PadR family transcriptional regulator [Thermoleophilaceae bacterium]|nr:PadR family transcriptional regulator [Thermoleophilaceae bacterium]